MDIGIRSDSRSYLGAAALAVVLIGLALSFLTWQNLERQRQTIEEHLFLSSQVILRGVESAMSREMRGFERLLPGMHARRGAGQPPLPDPLAPRLREMLSELIETSDVEFVAFMAAGGRVLFSVRSATGPEIPPLPASAWEQLAATGEWAALYKGSGGAETFVSGLRTKPGLARLCPEGQELAAGRGGPGAGPYLVVGITPHKHLETFGKFRRTALLQTGYVLMVAVFLWGLGAAYVRRRDQGRELHRLESFHSRLLDAMPDGLLTVSAAGGIRAANPAARDLLAGGGELVGQRFDALDLETDGVPGASCLWGKGWEQARAGGRSLEILSMPLPPAASAEGEAGERLVLVRDRTDLKALEDDLAEARQQAAIGRLAAGLAHEIRNPLSALRGFAQFFKKKLEGRQPEEQYAATMVSEADRLDKVISDLMFLSRPRAPEKADVDAAALAGDLRALLRFDLEHQGAELVVDMDPGAPAVVHADPDMLKQALLNLLLNSLAAVGANPPGEPRRIVLGVAQRDGRACVAVRDTGPGMTEQERAHALEPFFTSKKEGTGLGLAIVHRIVRNHGGRVDIETRRDGPDHGTEVRLCFPPAGAGDACEPEQGEP
ncbi:two-component system sensor histidine kinase NtrB [Desulfocurvus vexinensis]|uniref:two-component system sensor histidine kinase NtrB n=1 Tax=Desulfocurvus vexinensis TaxID=399548 RepID=UPI000688A440|nr:ATP-binding protein [Desulfocurvus vexinensis]